MGDFTWQPSATGFCVDKVPDPVNDSGVLKCRKCGLPIAVPPPPKVKDA